MKQIIFALFTIILLTQCSQEQPRFDELDSPIELRSKTTFKVRIEAINEGDFATPFAPGVYLVQKKRSAPVFKNGYPNFDNGLEELAEDGSPGRLNSSLRRHPKVRSHGIFDTPVGGAGAAPIFPGDAYEFSVSAGNNDRLNFATMFIQSNDLFIGPSDGGIPLFDRYGNPLEGDITDYIYLWDAGTEVNEEPGVGPNQAPRQSGPNTGLDENGVVQIVIYCI